MSALLIIAIPIILALVLRHLSTTDTEIGRRIRDSDRAAAEDAIERREDEIREIRKWMG